MNAFQIRSEILACVKLPDGEGAVNTVTGEVIDNEALMALEMSLDEKRKNIALWIKDLRAEADALAKYEKDIRERKKAAENKAESLKNLLISLDGVGYKFKCTEVSYGIRQGMESVYYEGSTEDIMELPQEFQKWRMEGLNKTAVMQALRDGVEVPGASIVRKPSVVVK